MDHRYSKAILIASVLAGVFITICDYLVQMITVEVSYFVNQIINLSDTFLLLASYGCLFTFPIWILGLFFIYKAIVGFNRPLAIIIIMLITYSLLMVSTFHYYYLIVDRVSHFSTDVVKADWELLSNINNPLQLFMFIILPIGWLIIGCLALSKKTIIPAWSIALNPTILSLILLMLSEYVSPFFEKIQPGIFSLAITSQYIIAYLSLNENSKIK